MKQSGWFGVVAISLAFAGQILAYNDAHGPFDNGANVKRISFEVMERTVGVGDNSRARLVRFEDTHDPGTRLLVHVEADGTYIEVISGNKTVFQINRFSDFSFVPGIEAYRADLNRDGERDFVVYAYSGGCGLASGYCDVAFLLSDRGDYRLTTVQTLWPNPDNYLLLGGKPCFIQTAFDGVETCRDGKEHHFWIYNILVIDAASMRLDNGLAPDFPKTIWYTFKPNHKETTIITKEQKVELIRRSQKEIFGNGPAAKRS